MRTADESWSTAENGVTDVEVWQQMLSTTHLPWSVAVPTVDGPVFEASVRRWWIGDLALVDCQCGPCSGSRQRRELASTDGEFIVVLITRSGCETVAQGDAETTMRPGDAVAWDSTKPARFQVWEPLSKRSLLIPSAALDEVSGRKWLSAGVTLNASAPATRLLTGYLDTLSQVLPGLSAAAVSSARNATLELFVGALRVDGDVPTTTTAHPALRALMDRYIAAHLLHDSVSPAALANAHGVSVRTVNRIFNATGDTVTEVVRLRRLARARQEVVAGHDPISTVAARWGFADSSHFSRTFKAHYGSPPTAYREHAKLIAATGGAAVHPGDAPVQATASAS